jgi:hypothetical protein
MAAAEHSRDAAPPPSDLFFYFSLGAIFYFLSSAELGHVSPPRGRLGALHS